VGGVTRKFRNASSTVLSVSHSTIHFKTNPLLTISSHNMHLPTPAYHPLTKLQLLYFTR